MTRSEGGKGPSQRQLRVGEQVRHALSELLQRGEVSDDLIEATVISVSEVRMSPDLKIATGLVESHYMTGFSGGRKAICPGLVDKRTIEQFHSPALLESPFSQNLILEGNPCHAEALAVARTIGVDFIMNVTLDRDLRLTGVFAGDLDAAHAAGCAFVKATAMAAVPRPFDIVITTNSGYPLDLNLYQAVKGMSAAAKVVKPGGAIICAAECWDGIPDHGLYGQLLTEASSPRDLLDTQSSRKWLRGG